MLRRSARGRSMRGDAQSRRDGVLPLEAGVLQLAEQRHDGGLGEDEGVAQHRRRHAARSPAGRRWRRPTARWRRRSPTRRRGRSSRACRPRPRTPRRARGSGPPRASAPPAARAGRRAGRRRRSAAGRWRRWRRHRAAARCAGRGGMNGRHGWAPFSCGCGRRIGEPASEVDYVGGNARTCHPGIRVSEYPGPRSCGFDTPAAWVPALRAIALRPG